MTDNNVNYALNEIERLAKVARGEHVENTPWDYNIPTARQLRYFREDCGLTREEVAQQIGYSKGTITNYENGDKPPGREFIEKCLLLYKREWPE